LLGEDTSGLSDQAAADKAITAVEKLRKAIGIPPRLRDIGVKEEQLAGFAEKAFGIKRILRVNPRAVSVEDLLLILQSAF
jgi:alcohol dehydrogenase class IV